MERRLQATDVPPSQFGETAMYDKSDGDTTVAMHERWGCDHEATTGNNLRRSRPTVSPGTKGGVHATAVSVLQQRENNSQPSSIYLSIYL